jgi:hypothetical protein
LRCDVYQSAATVLEKVVLVIEVPEIRVRTLCVLHQISVQARFMAYKRESHERIAALLDTAELIAIKMAHSVEYADEMRNRLQTLVQEFPELQYVLETFDGTVTNPPWRGW